MFIPRELCQCHRLLLLSYPPPALSGAWQVHRPVPITGHHGGLHVGKLVRIVEGLRCRYTAPIQAVDSHTGGCEIGHQWLRVLPHQPAVIKANVRVELFVVQDSVVEFGCLHQDLVEDRFDLVTASKCSGRTSPY